MLATEWTPVEARALHDALRASGWTIATAESLTCGRVQTALGATSGASAYFVGGLTAYALDAKIALLGVTEASARPVNGVSADVARQLAIGATRLFGTQIGLATTGYAEADPAAGLSIPYAWIAVTTPHAQRVLRVDLPLGDRSAAQAAATTAALRLLAGALSGQ